MSALLEKAYKEAKKASPEVQNSIAALILAELDDEAKWDASFAESQQLLADMAEEAMAEYRAGQTQDLDPATLGQTD